ncbi:cellulose biosynthesis cyclic di-GMP-binding regulatory protein BcsB [Rhizobium sp. SL86]|uniref:cellulose biosynthesis cyclic di-GMP-binding regulatory protein BcsB n=1 Tax=Rhizobium sp. SL86 TaxID=2995148 RepID=UPI0022727EEE|nr:cellulose biosynthesis cyclic di-GMP-binding regulatory protein BcsB [Rhizobium sp. SL86]MCY1669036.1 cellulose biosynthesis cyclic di-GMP-binding regulatory protein BcsB [Rhizobium sp. SL86]
MFSRLATSALILTILAEIAHASSATGGFVLAPKTRPQPTAPQTTQIDRSLRPIMADSNELFFAGEATSREFPFLVLPSEMTGTTKLIIKLQTAISVAPERSRLRLFVNDQDIGNVELLSGNARRIELDVPKGVLQPGYNSLVILADQSHRVDCSIDATYELWSQIDPAGTGFSFTKSSGDKGDDLSALLAYSNMTGRPAVRAILPRTASSNEVDQTISMVQSLVIAGQLDRAVINIASAPTKEPGVELAVGTFATLRQALGEKAGDLTEGIRIETNAETGEARLIASARSDEALAQLVDQFALDSRQHYKDGSIQGRRAMENRRGQTLNSGSRTALSNLGFISRPFSGRHYDQDFAFNLPADFYPGDYGAATLNLNADYAAGLSSNARLLVRANGDTVATVSLADGRSGRIVDQHLPIPLNKLRPGKNIIRFEADLSAGADTVCDPQTLMSVAPRLHVKADSSLEMPVFARVGHSPDLAVATAGNFAGGSLSEAIPLYIRDYNKPSLGAAATFLAKSAYLSGVATKVTSTSEWPADRTTPLLAVGTFGDLGRNVLSDLRIDLTPTLGNLTAANTSMTVLGDTGFAAFGDNGSSDIPAAQDGKLKQYADLAKTVAENAYERLKAQAAHLQMIGNPQVLPNDETYEMPVQADLVLAQRNTAPRSSWTILAARDEAVLQESVNAMTQAKAWSQIGGTVQAFDRGGKLIERKEAQSQELYETQAMSLRNGRLILAGWLANNPLEFTIAQVVAAILLGVSSFFVLRGGRRKQ